MGSIALGDFQVVFEVDTKDDLVVFSIHCGVLSIQAAISQEEYALLVDEMNRVQDELAVGNV